MFDPATQKFRRFDHPWPGGNTYGVGADSDGNGWWAQMSGQLYDEITLRRRSRPVCEYPLSLVQPDRLSQAHPPAPVLHLGADPPLLPETRPRGLPGIPRAIHERE